jgi:hypothetical protein
VYRICAGDDAGVGECAAGGEVELPAVPGAAKDLANPAKAEGGAVGREGGSADAPAAQWPAAVRTTVVQRVEPPVDVEYPDVASSDGVIRDHYFYQFDAIWVLADWSPE